MKFTALSLHISVFQDRFFLKQDKQPIHEKDLAVQLAIVERMALITSLPIEKEIIGKGETDVFGRPQNETCQVRSANLCRNGKIG